MHIYLFYGYKGSASKVTAHGDSNGLLKDDATTLCKNVMNEELCQSDSVVFSLLTFEHVEL